MAGPVLHPHVDEEIDRGGVTSGTADRVQLKDAMRIAAYRNEKAVRIADERFDQHLGL